MATNTYTSNGWVALCSRDTRKIIAKFQVSAGQKYATVGVEVVFAESEQDLDTQCFALGYK